MSSFDQAISATLLQVFRAYDGAFFGAGLALLALKAVIDFRSHSVALSKIREAPSVSVSDLRSLLSKDDDDSDHNSSPIVFVRGQVQSKSNFESKWIGRKANTLLSHDSGFEAVIVERTQTCLYNDWRGVLDWIFGMPSRFTKSRKQYQSSSLRSVPFVLTEGGTWPGQAFVVVNMDGSKHVLPLSTVYHHMQPVQPTPFTFLQALFGHGCPVGILDEEKILPVGKMITAIGICSLQDGVPEIRSSKEIPYFLSGMSKDQIADDLSFKAKTLLWCGIILGTTSLGVLGYSISRNWARWKAWRSRRQQQEAWIQDEAGREDEPESQEIGDGQLCVICLRRRRRSAFIPCGHLVCCTGCAFMVERDANPLCPICRQAIRSSVRVYDS